MMRILTFSGLICLLASTSASAGGNEELEAAALQLAVSANCRASYGDHELFEVAFARFEKIALKAEDGPSAEEIAEARQNLYEIEADEEENFFMRGFCETLREELIPAQ